jgi:uncharacterized protein (DUF302 family)
MEIVSKSESEYTFRIELPLSFEGSVELVTDALKVEGFGVRSISPLSVR